MFAMTRGGRLNVVKGVKEENEVIGEYSTSEKNEFKQRDSKLKYSALF